jgi:hypothetical protein
MKQEFDGAGGVPIRTREDLLKLKEASQRGNYPLMRCYSGTEDVFRYAPLLKETIDNAWAAIPLCWYNELDGRGERPVETSIAQSQELIAWHGKRNIPVEINEPHHWALRDAHDVMTTAMAYISARNAKACGVRDYIAQYMFNVPHGNSFSMDLARVLAMIELVESLADEGFRVYRQTRAGLPLLSEDEAMAKGQLAASTFMQMSVKPHIIHVVGYTEANHAVEAAELIESTRIVKGVVLQTWNDTYSMENDARIQRRKAHIISEAKYLLGFLQHKYAAYADPLANADVLAKSIRAGYLDAVHIVKNEKFTGTLSTRLIDGCCEPWCREEGRVLREEERLARLEARTEKQSPTADPAV